MKDKIHCNSCNTDSQLKSCDDSCPKCGSKNTVITMGKK